MTVVKMTWCGTFYEMLDKALGLIRMRPKYIRMDLTCSPVHPTFLRFTLEVVWVH